MALSIYTHDNPSSNMQQTHKYNSCAFSIGLSTKSFKDCLSQLPQIQGQYIDHIAGIADENIDVGYETSWGESPGAKISSKLKEFTRTGVNPQKQSSRICALLLFRMWARTTICTESFTMTVSLSKRKYITQYQINGLRYFLKMVQI